MFLSSLWIPHCLYNEALSWPEASSVGSRTHFCKRVSTEKLAAKRYGRSCQARSILSLIFIAINNSYRVRPSQVLFTLHLVPHSRSPCLFSCYTLKISWMLFLDSFVWVYLQYSCPGWHVCTSQEQVRATNWQSPGIWPFSTWVLPAWEDWEKKGGCVCPETQNGVAGCILSSPFQLYMLQSLFGEVRIKLC